MKPGEIWWADLPDLGPHMVVLLSRADLNRGNRVLAVPITSKRFGVRCGLPTCVPFRRGEHCLTVDCVAQCDAIGPIPTDVLDLGQGPVAEPRTR